MPLLWGITQKRQYLWGYKFGKYELNLRFAAILSAFADQVDVEFHGFCDGFQTDTLVITVDGASFFLG